MNQPYYMPAQAAAPRQLKQGLAIASLVCGLLGCLASIPGLVCGILAIKKANKNPAEYGGKGMAIAGVVLSSLSFVSIPMIAAIAIPNLMAARQAANEASVIKTMRQIGSAEIIYQSTIGGGERFATLEEMERGGLIKVGSSQTSGYRFKVNVVDCQLASGIAARRCYPHFEIIATPISYGSFGTGKRSFYMDESTVIRAVDRVGMDADRNAPPLQ